MVGMITKSYICKKMTQVDWLLSKLNAAPVFSFDSETSGNQFMSDHIFCMSFSWKVGLGACIDFRDFTEEEQKVIWASLKKVFANKSSKITQNGVFDIKFLWKKGISVNNWYCDTILMAHLLDENDFVGLGPLAHRYTDMGGYHDELDKYVSEHPECDPSMCRISETDWKKTKKAIEDEETIFEKGTYENIPKEMLDVYACQDADVTLRVYAVMMPKIKEEELHWVLFNIQMPTQKLLARVEYSGVTVDREYLLKLDVEYRQKMADAWEKVINIPEVQAMQSEKRGVVFAKYDNPKSKKLRQKYTLEEYLARNEKIWKFKASTKQLNELIIGKLGQKPIKYGKENIKTGQSTPSMDAEALSVYALTLPQVEIIQEHRTYQHLHGTFVLGMLKRLGADGRIRSNYPLFRTVTGRVASNDPNLNNIPRKAVEIKHQFIADPGCYLIEADYSQAEFRHWASYSQDQQMIYDINHGIDIHKLTAAMGKGLQIPEGNIALEDFKEWVKDITKEERNVAKNCVFGMMYGRGATSIAKQLKITKEEAENIIRMFFHRYPTAKLWLTNTMNAAKIAGYVRDLYGRKRRLPNIKRYGEEFKQSRAAAERMSVNSPIQGGASDTTFLAACRVHKEMLKRNMKSRLVLTVYDSIIYNVLPEELESMLFIVRSEMMRKTPHLKVNLDCEVKVGRVWGKLKEIHFHEDYTPKMEELDIEKKDSYIDSDPLYWFYHAESNCVTTMRRSERANSMDAALCIELGLATTEDESEGRRLLQENIDREKSEPTTLDGRNG